MSLRIIGTGSALPQQVVTNDMLSQIVDTSDEWIASRTGIRERRIIRDESLVHMGAQAAQKAMDDAGLEPGQVDYLLCSTVRGEMTTPALAAQIAGQLGMTCAAMDINAACVGFMYALDTAGALLQAGRARNVLIVAAEAMSRLADWADRATCVLFGDGAAAVVATKADNLLSMHINTQPNDQWLYAEVFKGNCPYSQEQEIDPYLKMNGQEVYKFAVSSAMQGFEAVSQDTGLKSADFDWFLAHQANRRIIDAIRQRMGLDANKFPICIDHTGNASSASLPILIDECNRAGMLLPGQKLFLCAFGAGLTSAACALVW